jgi:hypothetical protein
MLLVAGTGLVGVFGATWSDLFLAEIAKLAPPEMPGEAAASATFFIFAAYMGAYYCVAAVVLFAASAMWVGLPPERVEKTAPACFHYPVGGSAKGPPRPAFQIGAIA